MGLLDADNPLTSALRAYGDWWSRGPLGGAIMGTPQDQREPWDIASLAMGMGVDAGGGIPQRAAAAGYTTPVFHGTQAVMKEPWGTSTQAIPNFQVRTGGLKMFDGMGVHVGTPEAAQARLEANTGVKFGSGGQKNAEALDDSYIMPLLANITKPFVKTDGSYFTESELQSRLSSIAKKLGYANTRRYSQWGAMPQGFQEAQGAVRQHLLDQGYDAIPYINSHEDRGSTSYVILDPSNLRSKFAGFDPSLRSSSNLSD